MPPKTIDAFRDHGKVAATLEQIVDEAQRVLDALARAGISLDEITRRLVDEGVALFTDAADKLLGAVARKRAHMLGRSDRRADDSGRHGARETCRGGDRRMARRRNWSAACGSATRACGPATMKTNGSAGSTVWTRVSRKARTTRPLRRT